MKRYLLKFPVLFTVLICLFVFSKAYSQSTIPETWQPGMKLTMSYGGGMRYYSYKLQISDTGSYLAIMEQGRTSHYKLKLTKAHLDSLLGYMRKNQFDQIKTEMTGPAHDKGTENITLQWEGGWASAGESYASDVVEKDRGRYAAVYQYIYNLADRTKQKIKKQASPDADSPY